MFRRLNKTLCMILTVATVVSNMTMPAYAKEASAVATEEVTLQEEDVVEESADEEELEKESVEEAADKESVEDEQIEEAVSEEELSEDSADDVKLTVNHPQDNKLKVEYAEIISGSALQYNEIGASGVTIDATTDIQLKLSPVDTKKYEYHVFVNGVENEYHVFTDVSDSSIGYNRVDHTGEDINISYEVKKIGSITFDPAGGLFSRDGLVNETIDHGNGIYNSEGESIEETALNDPSYDFSAAISYNVKRGYIQSIDNLNPTRAGYKFKGWYEADASGKADESKSFYKFQFSGDITEEVKFVAVWTEAALEECVVTFDAGEGRFTDAGIDGEKKYHNVIEPIDTNKKILKYNYFYEDRENEEGYGKYGVSVCKAENIYPVLDGYKFWEWYEAKADGTPDLTRPYVYGYKNADEVRDVTYVAYYVKPLPMVEGVKITTNPAGFSFTVDVDYDKLKEYYNPATEVLMYQFGYAANGKPIINNDEAGKDGWYSAWNGYDVRTSNGEQTIEVHDPTMPFIFGHKEGDTYVADPVTEDVEADFCVRYVVIRKDEEGDRHYINADRFSADRNILNAGEYTKRETFTISPDTYNVNINSSSSNLTYTVTNDGNAYCKQDKGDKNKWAVGLKDSKGIKLTVTAKNSRIPRVKIGDYELPTPLPVSSKYVYVIPSEKIAEAIVKDAIYNISISEGHHFGCAEKAFPAYYRVLNPDDSSDIEWSKYPSDEGVLDGFFAEPGQKIQVTYPYLDKKGPEYVMVYFGNVSDEFPDKSVEIEDIKYTVFEYVVPSNVGSNTNIRCGTLPRVGDITVGSIEEINKTEGLTVTLSQVKVWRDHYYADNAANSKVTIEVKVDRANADKIPLIKINGSHESLPQGTLEVPTATKLSDGSNVYKYIFTYDANTKYKYVWLHNCESISIDYANPYKIKYDGNGADGEGTVATADVHLNSEYILSKNENGFTKTGYTFNGWNTQADGKGTAYAGGAKVKSLGKSDETVTLYAQWKPITYKVEFHANYPTGSDATKVQTLTYDVKANLTANTFKTTGASFTGWNTNANGGGTSYADKAEVEKLASESNAVVKLYAQWKTVDYVIFFDANGGEAGTLEKDAGAYLDLGGAEAIRAMEINIPSDDKLKDGYLQAMKYGEEVVLTGQEYVRRGYTLTGWKNSKTGKDIKNGKVTNLTTTPECITLTAQWKKDTYTIKYNLNGGAFNRGYKALTSYTVDSGIDPDDYLTTAAIQLPTADEISRKGYEFAGWHEDKNFEDWPIAYIRGDFEDDLELKSYNLYAKWTPITYKVTFKGNGDGATSDIVDKELSYDETYTIPVFSRPGYKFTGWNTEATPTKDVPGKKYTAKTVKNLTSNYGEEFTYYAQWSPNSYKVAYNLGGGRQVKKGPSAYTMEVEVSLSGYDPVKDGYTFNGWTLTMKDGSVIPTGALTSQDNVVEIARGIYGDVVLTANWTENKYNVRYYVSYAGFAKPSEDGWFEDENGVYYEKEYNYTDTINVDEVAKGIEAAVGSSEKSISQFTKGNTKYDLAKNYSKLEKTNGGIVNVTAKWSDKTYRISYDLNGDDVVLSNAPQNYKANATRDITIPKPTRAGYAFTGWEEDGTTCLNGQGTAIVKGSSGDVNLKANWVTLFYNVVIKLNNGQPDVKFSVPCRPSKEDIRIYSKSAIESKTGYTLRGLATDNKGKNLVPLTEDETAYNVMWLANKATVVTLYAIWDANEYDITYVGEGEGYSLGAKSPLAAVYGKEITLVNPVREGYTFLGWTTDTEGASIVTKDGKLADGSSTKYVTKIKKDNLVEIALTPNWSENLYTLKISSNSGVRKDTKKAETLTITDAGTGANKLTYSKAYDLSGFDFYNRYEKKGYSLVGFALDTKGKNMIELNESVSKLAAKNNATVMIYAIWEKVAVSVPTITEVTSREAGELWAKYVGSKASSATTRYEVQLSTSYNFRASATVSEVELGTDCTVTGLTSGKNYVRVREIRTDSQGNDIVSAWSSVKSVSVQ